MLVSGFAGVVYARSRSIAHHSLEEELRFRAGALAAMLEFQPDGIEFEVPPEMLPEFDEDGAGAWMEIVDPSGKVIVRSPSLGNGTLPAPGPWTEGGEVFTEFDGPGGVPCVMIARSFLARVDGDPGEEPAPGTGAAAAALPTAPLERVGRCRILVALDRRARDGSLADLALFLVLSGGAALLLSLGAGLLLAHCVLGPVHRMTAEAASLTPEDAHRRLRPDTVVGELHTLAATLNSALDRLGDALSRQRRFTSDASHELRTPVAVLMANAEHLLRRPRTDEEYRMGLRRQLRTARQMREVSENLLALARADAASAGIARDPVRLDQTAALAAEDLRSLAGENGVRVSVEGDGPVEVLGDSLHLHRLASNLLSNAVKFTPRGGSVTVRTAAVDGEAELLVEDTGPGIPEEDRVRIFDRFYRVGDRRQEAEGAGLGLAIVEGIAKAHGGRITVEGLPGEGSRFRVRLPLQGGGGSGGRGRPEA